MWDLIVSFPDHCLSFYFEAFNSTSRYLDDLLNIDNIYFEHMVDRIYTCNQLNFS